MGYIKAIPVVLVSVLGVSACDGGLYATAAGKDGSVIVVNRFTGVVQRVDGDTVVELRRKVPPANPDYRPTLATESIPKQPLAIRGIAKFKPDAMIVRITLEPKNMSMTKTEWPTWRSHIQECRSSGSINLEFQDRDGFVVASHELELKEMIQVANSEGEVAALEAQVTIPITKENFEVRSAILHAL
jgi:hypothetical protein